MPVSRPRWRHQREAARTISSDDGVSDRHALGAQPEQLRGELPLLADAEHGEVVVGGLGDDDVDRLVGLDR